MNMVNGDVIFLNIRDTDEAVYELLAYQTQSISQWRKILFQSEFYVTGVSSYTQT